MKTDFSKLPREELEARITTMLMGELEAEEARELVEFVAGDAELMQLHEELKATIGLVREATAAESRISEGKREALLASFKMVTAPELAGMGGARRRMSSWVALAAMVAFLLVVTGLMLPSLSKAKSKGTRVSSRQSAEERKSRVDFDASQRGEPVNEMLSAAQTPGTPLPASEPAQAGTEGRREEVRKQLATTYQFRYLSDADKDGAGVPQTKIELPALAQAEAQLEGKNWDFQQGRARWFGGFGASVPQKPAQAGAEIAVGKDLNAFYSDQPSARRDQLDLFGGRSDFGQAGLANQVADAVAPADALGFVDAKKSDAIAPSTGLPMGSAANAPSGSATVAAGEAVAANEQAAGVMGGGAMMSMNYYMSNPELMKRYFPQMYDQMQRGRAGGSTGSTEAAATPLPQRPAVKGVSDDRSGTQNARGVTGIAGVPGMPGMKAEQEVALGTELKLVEPKSETSARALTLEDLGQKNEVLAFDLSKVQEGEGVRQELDERFYKERTDAETFGRAPSEKVVRRSEEFQSGRVQTSTLVQDARSLIDLGRTDEAEKLLKRAQQNDPDHRAAAYYLKIVEEQKAKSQSGQTLAGRTVTDAEKPADEARTRVNLAKVVQEERLRELERVDMAAKKPAASALVPQPEVLTAENAFSTFSLNVSDVSFKLAAASLEKGLMPDVATVRSEEFINAFDYRDPEPQGAPVGFVWERARYPFAQDRDLVRFSVKTAASGRQAGRPLNLVLLLDSSGSMERADRVRILQECLKTLAAQLRPEDKISVVAFARTPRLWVDGLAGSQARELASRVGNLNPEGGTNLEEAMKVAYETARKHFSAEGVNRVVLLTDGAANLGDVEPESLKQKVEAERKKGIALDCFGIGWEGLNDELLETLSRNGDGRYGFVNSPEAAGNEFAAQLAGALKAAASDVKVQVEWNPKRVTAYRQIGYAKHQLTKEQFRDNTVDAAEIGAAEAGNALYTVQVNPGGDGPLGTVRVRFKVPGTNDYREHEWPLNYVGAARPLENSSYPLRLAGTASAFSEWLASSPYASEVTTDRLLSILSGVPEHFAPDSRPKKLEWMIRQAKSLAGK